MAIGVGTLVFSLGFLGLIVSSLLWRQALAPWLLLAGVVLIAYLGASVVFDFRFPYRTHNVSIYIVFFVAAALVVAGSVGWATHFVLKMHTGKVDKLRGDNPDRIGNEGGR